MRHDEQGNPDHPEAVRSAPVAVPPPGTTDADEPYRDRDGRPDGDLDRDGDLDGDGRPEFHEPAPLPTAFGATTVGDAVAASALASGRPADERDARAEDTALPGDGAPGRTDAFDDERADPTAGDRLHSRERWAGEHAEGGQPTRDDDVAGYGSATPTMVDPDAEDRDADTGRDPRTSPEAAVATAGAGMAGVAGAGLAGAARPAAGAVPADAATLFEPETAQGFRDRWRDVQLRFVDDPRAAVGEAQSLVEEAIQALSSALAAQKDKLGGWQDSGSVDTEQLRVAVRQYRDFLDRVLGR
ncbi:hypothetical protein [Micromonospora mirobrigensis]|uniref:Uncharacterized protein n=1 Tax=Micromonospora mirobrigensis TaxID=262898 RepID=A0A1C4XKU6_9ACTN|nr:hypothetical protein [Micromonospora mirobrigensis]SCF09139.1 hypothetical protein GA0070564_103175 [Micromonospora mirobrigensis]